VDSRKKFFPLLNLFFVQLVKTPRRHFEFEW
jgi:hypothetical protein